MHEIDIRLLKTSAELEEVRQLESKVWGEAEAVPVHQTLTVTKNGGLVLGAFSHKKLIGFQYSFPGYDGKSIYLCSHILAVDPAFRSSGIGEKLKQAQREYSKQLNYSYISWTYDPLESVNGYLNIGKLKAVCSTYIENCYGEMNDPLNADLPSDRFVVKWDTIESIKLPREYTMKEVIEANMVQWKLNDEGFPFIQAIREASFDNDRFVAVAIPSAFQQMKDRSPSIALEWRMQTRKLFTEYFSKGYEVTNFMKHKEPESPVHFYILTRKEAE